MRHLRDYVCRAADEFRAADNASSPEAAEAHLQIAYEFIHLINCDGSQHSYRMLRARRLKKLADAAGTTVPNLPVAA